MHKLKYVDVRPLYFPKGALKFYPGGRVLPDKENEIKVTDDEKRMLLKRKNGKLNCFEEVRETRSRQKSEDTQEAN